MASRLVTGAGPCAQRLLPFVIALLAVAVSLAYGIQMASNKGYPSQIGVLSQVLITPFMFILPLVAALLGSLTVYMEVGNRFTSLVATRRSLRRYLAGRLVQAAVLPSVVYFAYAVFAFVVAYIVWPQTGNPGVDPSNYQMTNQEAQRAEVADTSYSQLLGSGLIAYCLGYSAWLGISAGFYSVAAALCLVVLPNRLAAIAIPTALYLGESVIGIVVIGPQAGLVYSLFPFGLTQLPIVVAAAPQLAFNAAVVILGVHVFVSMRRKGYLT